MSETEDKIIQNLLTEVAELRKQKKGARTWFSKEMIGIYSAVVAGVLAWGNSWLENRAHKEEQKEAKQEDVQKRRRVDTTVLTYVDQQIEEVYGTCDSYLEAVMQAMPPHQRRKVERFLDGAPMPVAEVPPPAPEPEELTRAAVPLDAYQVILEAAEEGEPVPVEAIVKKRAQKMRKR